MNKAALIREHNIFFFQQRKVKKQTSFLSVLCRLKLSISSNFRKDRMLLLFTVLFFCCFLRTKSTSAKKCDQNCLGSYSRTGFLTTKMVITRYSTTITICAFVLRNVFYYTICAIDVLTLKIRVFVLLIR